MALQQFYLMLSFLPHMANGFHEGQMARALKADVMHYFHLGGMKQMWEWGGIHPGPHKHH